MQISFLRHASSLTFVLGGLEGMREDVRGVGKPLDAPKDPSADLGNLLPLFGTSHNYFLIQNLLQLQLQLLKNFVIDYISVQFQLQLLQACS